MASTSRVYWKVVDHCYLCDMCYMTKCPYVPPHPWNVDFPHLMLRAKAVKFKKGKTHMPRPSADRPPIRSASWPASRWWLASSMRPTGTRAARTDVGKSAGRPSRRGVARISSATRCASAWPRQARRQCAATPTRGRPAARWRCSRTCYGNYNEPRPRRGSGRGVRAQRHSGAPRPKRSAAAACPSWSWVIWKPVHRAKEANIPVLRRTRR